MAYKIMGEYLGGVNILLKFLSFQKIINFKIKNFSVRQIEFSNFI